MFLIRHFRVCTQFWNFVCVLDYGKMTCGSAKWTWDRSIIFQNFQSGSQLLQNTWIIRKTFVLLWKNLREFGSVSYLFSCNMYPKVILSQTGALQHHKKTLRKGKSKKASLNCGSAQLFLPSISTILIQLLIQWMNEYIIFFIPFEIHIYKKYILFQTQRHTTRRNAKKSK